jgi:membrane fusion protein (multidrug efflux system)
LVPPTLELVATVEEQQLGKFATGQPVQISVPAVADQMFDGAVTSIAPSVDGRTRTAAVRIQAHDAQGQLRAGMSATAAIVTGSRQEALVVPRQALKLTGKDNSVLLIDDADRVRIQMVRLGLQNETSVEITQGIAEGQRVATSNLSDLRDGDLVVARADRLVATTAGSN